MLEREHPRRVLETSLMALQMKVLAQFHVSIHLLILPWLETLVKLTFLRVHRCIKLNV
jgi:hypothetical protein